MRSDRVISTIDSGTAYLTGFSQFLFDPDDPVRAGYLLEA
jgi:proline racemase